MSSLMIAIRVSRRSSLTLSIAMADRPRVRWEASSPTKAAASSRRAFSKGVSPDSSDSRMRSVIAFWSFLGSAAVFEPIRGLSPVGA